MDLMKQSPETAYLDIGIQIHARFWSVSSGNESREPILLLHGLSSNARTWDAVARDLSAAGHPVVAVDQRGHGLSEKPDSDYDFETFTGDLFQIVAELGWDQPILVGQSWGGNLLLEFGARFPGAARGLVFVDGGFLHLRERGTWEEVAQELRPPNLVGMPKKKIADRIGKMNPEWSEEGIEATLGNFEILPDDTIRPWLTLDRHLKILHALYEQDPPSLFPQVEAPVLICAADDGSDRVDQKRLMVEAAASGLKQGKVVWFEGAAHDIHVHKPADLAAAILSFLAG